MPFDRVRTSISVVVDDGVTVCRWFRGVDGSVVFCGEAVAVFVGVWGGMFFCFCLSAGLWGFSRLGSRRAGVAVAGFLGRLRGRLLGGVPWVFTRNNECDSQLIFGGFPPVLGVGSKPILVVESQPIFVGF